MLLRPLRRFLRVARVRRWDCEDGYREEDYGDDVVSDMQVVVCDTCRGYGGWNQCGNDAKWCEANPLPGRESVKRGTLEWFRDYEEERLEERKTK